VQLSPARSWQQQLLHDGVPAAALHVRNQQRQRQVLLRQQMEVGAVAAYCPCTTEDTQDAPAAPTAGWFDSSGVSAEAAAAAGAWTNKLSSEHAAAADDDDAKLSVGMLLRDGVYVRQLLASLPGVDARSPHVQHAVRELQGGDETV
jgi:hypothetical protein